MIKYICDKCEDSFVKDGIYSISLKSVEFDLCGRCVDSLQEQINNWLDGDNKLDQISRIIKLHEDTYVGYEPVEAKRRLIYDLKQVLQNQHEEMYTN